ncbi:MAG: cobalamin 5'-phosphate synthase [Elusimicrobia bacterium RIFOXYB2_FULL_49_7]|nr:MAG: cobalamin 5'-phosphate synthase [Elusimicrobia bacterium RIFOXYB2_FULL_49_7]
MKHVLSALQFLTILPLPFRQSAPLRFSGMVASFPLAGLLLGLLLAGTDALLCRLFPATVCGVLLVVLLALVTGGLHLDGLADTADGIGSGKDRERTLEIMRDSRIGAMGVIALIAVFLMKISFLSLLLGPGRWKALLLFPVLGRWAIAYAITVFPYARSEGKALSFFQETTPAALVIATLLAGGAAFSLLGNAGLAALLAAGICAHSTCSIVRKRIDGITGDTLGAVNELCETASLAVLAVFLR